MKLQEKKLIQRKDFKISAKISKAEASKIINLACGELLILAKKIRPKHYN